MFRSLGSVLCMVVMAAFVFGCGGGGGGTAQPPGPPPPTPPTDAERINQARQMVATILSNAQTRAGAASSTASALGTNQDATADQIASAGDQNTAVQAALADIVRANTAALAATTPAAAQAAQTAATTAQNTLNIAADAIGAIQRAVQAVTDARTRREMDQIALTNNSSLIQHVRDNKLVFDAILADLKNTATDPLTVGPTVAGTSAAVYPKDTGTGAARVVGMRTVTVTPTGGSALTSNSTTPTLSGTGRLPHGFDLKNAAGTTFVNAYTDITKTVVRRTQTVLDDSTTTGTNEAMFENRDVADTDYLLAGIWIQNNTIGAFAYGSEPLTATVEQCGPTEGASASNGDRTRACSYTSPASISNFVEDGRDVNATYSGQANGARLAAGETSYFTADVNLTAQFVNPTGGADADNNGSIEGAVTNIVAGGQQIAGSIELQQHTFGNAIGEAFTGDAVGVVDGKSYGGSWEGQFFGQEFRKITEPLNTATDPATATVRYEPQAPGSVAGSFYVVKESTPEDEAFIGAFGAHR